jgi:alpha-tubulin suppressor-like RCC1 family protein
LRDSLLPQPAKNIGEKIAKHISSGGSHTGFVSMEGVLLTCGAHLHGKLGIDAQTDISKFMVCKYM